MSIMLISPVPPPVGGIATWTTIYSHYCEQNNIPLRIINSALQGRRACNINNKISFKDEVKRTLYVVRSYIAALKHEVPAIIHVNCSCSRYGMVRDCLCVLIAAWKKIPVVLQCHCNIADQLKGWMSIKAFEIAARYSARVLVLNRWSAIYAEKYVPGRVIMIPNFVERESLINRDVISDTVNMVLFVGHVQRTKGLNEIIGVAQKLPDIHFVIVGPVQEELKQQIWPQNVLLTGAQSREQVREYMKKADVFLFPSYTEGFSNALAEAMASGLPVVATDVGANRDMIGEGGGIIVPVGKQEEIVEALGVLQNDVGLRRQMSMHNFEKVCNEYSVGVVMEKLLSMYDTVCQEYC